MISQTPDGVIISVKVIPKASFNAIVGSQNDELRIRIAAVPEKGKANEELIAFFAKYFKISKSKIKILSGESSAHKKILIQGFSIEKFHAI